MSILDIDFDSEEWKAKIESSLRKFKKEREDHINRIKAYSISLQFLNDLASVKYYLENCGSINLSDWDYDDDPHEGLMEQTVCDVVSVLRMEFGGVSSVDEECPFENDVWEFKDFDIGIILVYGQGTSTTIYSLKETNNDQH